MNLMHPMRAAWLRPRWLFCRRAAKALPPAMTMICLTQT